jgi:hypothetical protein
VLPAICERDEKIREEIEKEKKNSCPVLLQSAKIKFTSSTTVLDVHSRVKPSAQTVLNHHRRRPVLTSASLRRQA